MRPKEVEDETIIAAGRTLESAGRKITGFALRGLVGGGNPNRLKKVWDEHQSSQSVVELEPVAQLPIEVEEQLKVVTKSWAERITALAVDLNDKAVKTSERRVAEMVRATSLQREQAEQELVDAGQAVDDLEQQLMASEKKNTNLDWQLCEGQVTNHVQAIEIAQLKERLASAVHSVEQAGTRETNVQVQLDDARNREQAVREGEAKALGALASAEQRKIEDAEIVQQLRGELRAATDALAKAETRAIGSTEQRG